MSDNIKLFIIDFDDFNDADIENITLKLRNFDVELDSNSKTYKEKLFSQFIRHNVLRDFLKLSEIEFSVNQNNKPYLESHSHTYFNISHSKNHIVMAVADREIGVDIEEIVSKKGFVSIAKRYFSYCEINELEQSLSLEKDFYTLWTLKESQVKRNSLGIAYGLKDATFFKKGDRWVSENFSKDFLTCFYGKAVMSICVNDIVSKKIELIRIDGNGTFIAAKVNQD